MIFITFATIIKLALFRTLKFSLKNKKQKTLPTFCLKIERRIGVGLIERLTDLPRSPIFSPENKSSHKSRRTRRQTSLFVQTKKGASALSLVAS
jgi:hypothetical protein